MCVLACASLCSNQDLESFNRVSLAERRAKCIIENMLFESLRWGGGAGGGGHEYEKEIEIKSMQGEVMRNVGK